MALGRPSVDQWLQEAKQAPGAEGIGMYLTHNGVVRSKARAMVRNGDASAPAVVGMRFSSDPEKVRQAVEETRSMPGIGYVRVWLNEGDLQVGDDIMLALVGGDIRPHTVDALQFLVGRLKTECVRETEIFVREKEEEKERSQ